MMLWLTGGRDRKRTATELCNDEDHILGFTIMWNNRISAAPWHDFPEFYLQLVKKKNVFDPELHI